MSTRVSALERLVSDANNNGAKTVFLGLRYFTPWCRDLLSRCTC